MTVNSTRDFIPPEPFEGQNYKPRFARTCESRITSFILIQKEKRKKGKAQGKAQDSKQKKKEKKKEEKKKHLAGFEPPALRSEFSCASNH